MRMHVAGNVTEDLSPAGEWIPGGPALYLSLVAAALGVKVDLITRVSKAYDRTVFQGLNVRELPAATACRYQNRYDASGARTQLLLAPGEPLGSSALACEGADICVVAPAYHEFDELVPACDAPVRGVLLQSALRTTNGQAVTFHPDPLCQAAALVTPGAWVFLSEEDAADAEGLARSLGSRDSNVFLTRGHRGATLFQGGSEHTFPAIPAANVVDPTGAGDCFAGAFLVRFAETGDVLEAARFALAAGSLAVEGPGIAAIPTRDAIQRRLAKEAA